MAKLSDFLEISHLQQLQDAFVDVAHMPLLIVDAGGEPLTSPSRLDGAQAPVAGGPQIDELCRSPIEVDGELLGQIIVYRNPQTVFEQSRMENFCRAVALSFSAQVGKQKQFAVRLNELAALHKLTTEFSARRDLQNLLDLVARTVVDVLKAKGCSIRLLSEDRKELVIKAVANLSKEYLAKGPILVSDSIIDQEVLQTLQPVFIRDERSDSRVLYPAQARREGIVSAFCAPIVYRGRSEGVIRVYTGEVHEFDRFEVLLLQAIAAQAGVAIINTRLYQEALRSADLKRQLRMAGEVQQRMIPAHAPQCAGVEIGMVYVPSLELGGDFYDFITLGSDNFGLAVCDVVGKGVRASLLMASIRASLRAHAVNVYSMSEVMAKVNRDLCSDTLTSDFATLFYAVLDHRTRRLTYSNAGHLPPLLVRDGKTQSLLAGGPVIGVWPETQWSWEAVSLEPGDVILVYTDGLSDAVNFADEPFGHKRVARAAGQAVMQGQSAQGVVNSVLWEMRRFVGLQSTNDDLTMVALKIL